MRSAGGFEAVASKGASRKKGAPKGHEGATPAAPPTPFDQTKVNAASPKRGKAPAKTRKTGKAGVKKAVECEPKAEPATGRGNKKETVIALMKRPQGATLADMNIESSKNSAGDRIYMVAM